MLRYTGNVELLGSFFRLLKNSMPYATAGFNTALFDHPVLLAHTIADSRLCAHLTPQITIQELNSWIGSSRNLPFTIRPGFVVHLEGYDIQWHFCFQRHNGKPCVKMHVGAAVYLDLCEFVRGVHEIQKRRAIS